VVYEAGKPIEVEELELDGPKDGEVLIKYLYAGLCHSDVHVAHGDLEARLPMVLGHEGAGVIEEVGPGVTRVAPGDNVVCSFIPNCGVCRYCANGQQSICDMGATILEGYLPGERFVFKGPRGDYGAMCMLGTFSQYATIHQNSVVKVDDDLPLDKAVLVGCGVPTGWGSAVHAAGVRAGDTVVIYGAGGVGSNAVQGAALAGAERVVVVDPVPFKREMATVFGATHTFASAKEAQEFVVESTWGELADHAIITVGVLHDEVIADALQVVGKAGQVTVTAVGNGWVNEHPGAFIGYQRRIQGAIFGACNPLHDVPRLISLYKSGKLKLDELITRTYRLEDVNQGYQDMLDGKNIRGVIIHEH
jgi:NDMA-dependent alcohol dehydrogenase